jgi:type IV secretion system protein VirD4
MKSNSFSRTAPSPVPDRQEQGLLLGWNEGVSSESFGFTPGVTPSGDESGPVTYDGDSHLITCAPTGSGKGRSVLIPTLLNYRGPVIVIDIKGENFFVTSRRRRELGTQVVALDPFNLVTTRSDGLNPLDLLGLPRSDGDSDAEMLASLLAVGNEYKTDPFWNTMANGLVAGLVAHIASYSPKERHLGHLRRFLFHQDLEMEIATMLDKDVVKSRMAREQFIAYLSAPSQQTRPSIRAMATSYVSVLGSGQVVKCLQASSFSLQDVYDGRQLSIYIVIPPDKLDSHRALLRLWVGTLLTTITRRTSLPRQRTLFLLDECAQLGTLPILRQAITLLRGSGLQTWSFWQDFSQLRSLYPTDWQTILNNSGVIQIFGVSNHGMARECSEMTGQSPEVFDGLAREDAVVVRHGQGSIVCRRPDYLKDEAFAGMFDANPRFGLQGQPGRWHL